MPYVKEALLTMSDPGTVGLANLPLMPSAFDDHIQDPTPRRLALVSLLICLCLLLLDRCAVLHQFGFRYVDDDQAIMWSGAMEMAQGRFHEPCYYGQSYNSMLEGLLAVPLLWMGAAPGVALPLVTSLLALFPFVLLASLLFRRGDMPQAAFVLMFPVVLSPEFGMITSMPRGFVTGVFLASLSIFPLFSNRGVFLFLSPFFGVLALFANPNSVLVLVPIGVLIWLKHYADRRLYVLGTIGAAPAAIFYCMARGFYDARPNYVVHKSWDLAFDASGITWDHLEYLNELSPFLWGKGGFVLLVMVLLSITLLRARQWKVAVALFAGVTVLLASLGVNKVHDGAPSVFFPWARMFLAVPFMLVLFVAHLEVRSSRWTVWLMPLIAGGFLSFKVIEQDAAIDRQMAPWRQNFIEVMNIDDLDAHCRSFAHLARANRSRLLVISWGARKHLTNYACPCLMADFPETIEPWLDRRTWWLDRVSDEVVPNVLFAGFAKDNFKGDSQVEQRMTMVNSEPMLYLLKDNTLRTGALLDSLRIGMRPH